MFMLVLFFLFSFGLFGKPIKFVGNCCFVSHKIFFRVVIDATVNMTFLIVRTIDCFESDFKRSLKLHGRFFDIVVID